MEYLIGTTGWSYGFWKGSFYPRGISSLLAFYSTQSSVVEINSSYYQIPTPELLERWNDSTSEDFQFFTKMYQGVTHSDGLISEKIENLVNFMTVMQKFEKLKGILFQFPFSFNATDENVAVLNQLLSTALDMTRSLLFLEFRNNSWIPKLKDIRSISNSILIAQSTKMQLPLDILEGQKLHYFRILGSRKEMPDHLLGIKRLKKETQLVELAEMLSQLHGDKAFVFVNNRFSGNGVKDAQSLHLLIRKKRLPVRGFKPASSLDDFL